jgi:TatD DNase family protein
MHDSHIHLALDPLKTNLKEVINEFKQNNGKYILTQGTDIQDFTDTLKIGKEYPETVQVALGLHPTFFEETILCTENCDNVENIARKYIDQFEEIFRKNISNISAIGETGLDYYQSYNNENLGENVREIFTHIQKESLKKHASLALEYNLPISIHSREKNGSNKCVEDTLEILANIGKGHIRGSFHSYTGDINMVDEILDLGFHIGFNAIITYPSGENVRDILRKVPQDRILLETDGPFLPPQSVRKDNKCKEKYAKPIHVREVLNVISEVKGIDSSRLENILDDNYKALFL